jgi:pimeloyl-ACP methyl ester carboxylesterase
MGLHHRIGTVVLSASVGACFWPVIGQSQAPTAQVAQQRCSSIGAMKLTGIEIVSAQTVAEGTTVGPFGAQPAHCLVKGEVGRHKGADGNEYGDKFELRLPDHWTDRMYFQGGGGLDGILYPALGASVANPSMPSALSRGYAVVSTDGGHAGKNPLDASFGADPQALADYEYRSTDRVAKAARKIIVAYYGREPQHAYMVGCSNGGREAMIASERYPDDFDGIVAGDPAFDLTKAAIGEAWNTIRFAEIAPKDEHGMPDLKRAFPLSDLNLLSSAILKACDALDGLVDGIIDNPRACKFNPAVLQCAAQKNDACLSADQVRILKAVFAGPKNSSGESLYSDWPYDSGVNGEDWRGWNLGNDRMPIALNAMIYPQFVNHVALAPGESPIASPFSFNFDTDPGRVAHAHDAIDATSTQLDKFRNRRGKIIYYTGMSDPVFSADDLIRYYQQLASENGGTNRAREFARLFLIPGMNHCGGGPALDQFDALSAIEAWVEKGIAPESMTATGKTFPGRSRPLCAYPGIARYKGSGSKEDSANFVCSRP